jgi:hypothetical protein
LGGPHFRLYRPGADAPGPRRRRYSPGVDLLWPASQGAVRMGPLIDLCLCWAVDPLFCVIRIRLKAPTPYDSEVRP